MHFVSKQVILVYKLSFQRENLEDSGLDLKCKKEFANPMNVRIYNYLLYDVLR